MTTDERIDKICALEILPYKERSPKLKKIGIEANYDAWYDDLINHWIVNQPDSDALMALFILCDFQPLPFVTILIKSEGDKSEKTSSEKSES